MTSHYKFMSAGRPWSVVGFRIVLFAENLSESGESRRNTGVLVHVGLRRRIGTFYLLAQELIFRNSNLNKSTTVCKVGDLEVSPKPS